MTMTTRNEELEIVSESAPNGRPAEPVPPRKSARRLWIGAAFVLALGAAVSAFLVQRRAPEEKTPSAAVASDTIALALEQRTQVVVAPVEAVDLPVQTAVVARVDFNENRVTPLFVQFAGRVVRVDAEPGASVRQGQVLAVLDSPDIVALQSDYLRARADQEQAAAAERTAQSSLDLATRTRERADRLATVEAIPQRELQEAQVAEAHAREELRRAQSGVAAAQSALAAFRRRLEFAGLADQDIEGLDKGGPAAIVRLTPVTAPVSGTIVARNVGLGQLVQAGGEPLFKIADLSTVWINADVYEDQLVRIRAGSQVAIRVPAYPNDTFTARVERIASVVDPEKRTVAVKSVLPNPQGTLKPGMFASVVLDTGTMRRTLAVPYSAVIAKGNRRTVFVELEPGMYREKLIETGDEINGSVVVKAGLQEGQRIVVQGGLLLSRQMAEARSSR
jgi:cobalt-zinc-cadmium efflux system membrane fusion protein